MVQRAKLLMSMAGALSKATRATMVCTSPLHLCMSTVTIHCYSDKAADILAALCMRVSSSLERPLPTTQTASQEAPTWLLKANVTVFRHADRTPKVRESLVAILSSLTPLSF